ncbi:MAG: helix-turn-helix transcriptional regulator [Candidatus Omnitrophica bacterium]|nr:helix-turn-helix transcriptional regulator [Candidatus Omnitrophota bacterium]
MLKNLGSRIRTIRKEKGVTLVELSEKTGVAQATLSRIETGTMSGTIESHEKIAEALGIGLADLYVGVDKRYEEIDHMGQADERKVTHHSRGIQIELLTQESSKKKITPLLLTLAAKTQTPRENQERGVEKFFYVLEGEIRATVDKAEFVLKAGETLYFDASLSHSVENVKDIPAKLLIAVSPSQI